MARKFPIFLTSLLVLLTCWTGGAKGNPDSDVLDKCFENAQQCSCYETGVSCYYFNDFSTLDFSKNNLTTKVSSLTFGPWGTASKLDTNFTLDGIQLADDFNCTFDRSFTYDLAANPFTTAKGNVLELRTLTLIFMHEHKHVNTSQDCAQLMTDVSKTRNIFTLFNRVLFPQVEFDQVLCPIMFANARLEELYVDSQFEGGKSNFQFYPIDDSAIDLNCSIKSFAIHGNQVDLQANFLDKHVLKDMESLTIKSFSNVKGAFDELTFEPFRKLRYLELDMESFSDLLKPPTKWMKWLNVDVHVHDLTNATEVDLNKNKQMLLVIHDYLFDYHFGEKDLCKFYYYPHNKLVFTKVIPSERPTYNCSCPLLWTQLHWKLYNGDGGSGHNLDLMTSATESCLNVTDAEFDRMVAACQFTARFQNCTEYSLDTTLPPATTTLLPSSPTETATSTTTTTTVDHSDPDRVTTTPPVQVTTVLADNSTQDYENSTWTSESYTTNSHHSSTTRNTLAEKLKESDRQITTLSIVVGALVLLLIAFLALSVLTLLKTRRKQRSMNLLYRVTAEDESVDFTAD